MNRPQYRAEEEDPLCLDPDEAAELLVGAPWRRVVIVGDSVAAGVLGPCDGYRELDAAKRLALALAAGAAEFAYANLGRRDLLVETIRREQLVPALALRPDLAILAAGGNDALGREFDDARVAEELAGLAEPLASAGALVVTIGLFDWARSGMAPPRHADLLARRFDRLDELTAELSARLDGVHVDNHHHPLAADPAIFAEDRVHANARGHAVAAANLMWALSARIDPVRFPPESSPPT